MNAGMPMMPSMQPQPAMMQGGAAFDVQQFLASRQLHIQNNSLYDTKDPLLFVHPDDLKPENQAALQDKITHAYTMEYPTFFHDSAKKVVGVALADIVPLSLESEKAVAARKAMNVMLYQTKGISPELAQELQDQEKPFSAVIADYLDEKKDDHRRPEFIEKSKNAVGMYLVVERALKDRGYAGKPSDFISAAGSADGIVSRLAEKFGMTSVEFTQTAQLGGYEGLGRKLGVNEAYLGEVKRLNNYLSDHHFSANAIQSWKAGGELAGMEFAGVQERIAVGQTQRVATKMRELAAQPVNAFTPQAVRDDEQKMLAAMRLAPNELAETLYLLKTDMAYTPEYNTRAFSPNMNNTWGYHWHVTNQPDDIDGVRQIVISATNNAENFQRTVVHEMHHLAFPNRYTKQEIDTVDALTNADSARLSAMMDLRKEWLDAGPNQAARQQVWNKLNSPEFSVNGMTLQAALGGRDINGFFNRLDEAHGVLRVDSERFARSGYSSRESRFKEINSRYSEMRYVSMADDAALLQFIVPNTTAIYEQLYMPKVQEQLTELRAREGAKQAFAQAQAGAIVQSVSSAPVPPCCAHGPCPVHAGIKQPQTMVVASNVVASQLQAPMTSASMMI